MGKNTEIKLIGQPNFWPDFYRGFADRFHDYKTFLLPVIILMIFLSPAIARLIVQK